MVAEVGSYQLIAGEYSVMIKIIKDGLVVYWAERGVPLASFNPGAYPALCASALAEAQAYFDSLGA